MGKERRYKVLTKTVASRFLPTVGMRHSKSKFHWNSDEIFWLLLVSFQSNKWGGGVALNVGCNWLWERDLLGTSLNLGGRLGDFIQYDDDDQYVADMERLCEIAISEAQKLRLEYRTFEQVAEVHSARDSHLKSLGPDLGNSWDAYHAGIAYGLAGHVRLSESFLDGVVAQPTPYEWQARRAVKTKSLLATLPDAKAFRDLVGSWIKNNRQTLALADVDIFGQ